LELNYLGGKLGVKSTNIALKNRGMATKEDITEVSMLTIEQLITLLCDKQPYMRSAAAINLSSCVNEVADELLEQLSKESCLYTRIAICESLEKGNIGAARKMTGYLGQIGNNQHKVLPEKVSAKKSFPLPRDMIARSLGKMDISILPVISDVIIGNNKIQRYEVLDAFGYMVFYNPDLATSKNCQLLLSLVKQDEEDLLQIWKVILCLSAFPCMESKEFLLQFASEPSILGCEAQRSLRILERRKN
jgi:hypothetical protein